MGGGWGSHEVEEPLYREVGVHDGPTIKPIELRAGIIEHMTPDMARVVGELSANNSSRGVARTLRATGLVPPSRAFLAKHTTEMGIAIADHAATLEQAARALEVVPKEEASISAGLDPMSVRMSEPADPATASSPHRTEPYERTPPPPPEHHYRKAWVGSTSAYDVDGKELFTMWYAAEADADPTQLAERVATDIAWILKARPGIPIHCVQDAAPELDRLPEALTTLLPVNTNVVQLVDFEHLMGYLDDIVDRCEPVVFVGAYSVRLHAPARGEERGHGGSARDAHDHRSKAEAMSEGPLDLTAFQVDPGCVELRPSPRRREWMEETAQAFAYRCVPLALANQHGWEILTPFAFEVTWNGGAGSRDVTIDAPATASAMITSHFGSGIVTFNPMLIMRTPPEINLWLTGPPNSFKDGIQALSALIETDWMPYTFSMNWKITRPNTRIRFEQGEPFCFFFPVPRGAIAAYQPVLASISDDPELAEQYRWGVARRQLDDMVGDESADKFQTWYKKGELPKKGAGRGAPASHETAISPRPFRARTPK